MSGSLATVYPTSRLMNEPLRCSGACLEGILDCLLYTCMAANYYVELSPWSTDKLIFSMNAAKAPPTIDVHLFPLVDVVFNHHSTTHFHFTNSSSSCSPSHYGNPAPLAFRCQQKHPPTQSHSPSPLEYHYAPPRWRPKPPVSTLPRPQS